MSAQRQRRRERGVTLVELVVVLTLIGVIASIGATLVGRVAASQQDNRSRLTLALASDPALARISDDLQQALPNSLRLSSSGPEVWIEWVPVNDAGRWRSAADTQAASTGDPLDLEDPADSSFDVIGTAIASLPSGSQLVIGNLGTTEADAYAGNNRRAGVALNSGGTNIGFTPNGALPASTGTQRFFIVATPVTLACRDVGGGRFELRRYAGYGWLATQPVSAATLASADSELLLSGLTGCSAAYSSALANIGLLNLRLGLADTQGSARMDFLAQLPVDNTP